MRKYVVSVLFLLALASCETVKYVEPTDLKDRDCVDLAKKAKNACVAERQEELGKCEVRVKETYDIERKQMLKDYPNATTQEIMLWVATKGITGEKCSDIVQKCEEAYKKDFQDCGGRIEIVK